MVKNIIIMYMHTLRYHRHIYTVEQQRRSQDFEVEEAETTCAKRVPKIFNLVTPTSLILGTWDVMCGSKADL